MIDVDRLHLYVVGGSFGDARAIAEVGRRRSASGWTHISNETIARRTLLAEHKFGECLVHVVDLLPLRSLDLVASVLSFLWRPILCLDPGLSCGWAVRSESGYLHSGAWTLRARAERSSMVAHVVRSKVKAEIERERVGLVCYEKSTFQRGHIAAGLYAVISTAIEEVCVAADVPCDTVTSATWKKRSGLRATSKTGTYFALATERWPHLKVATTDEAAARLMAADFPPQPQQGLGRRTT